MLVTGGEVKRWFGYPIVADEPLAWCEPKVVVPAGGSSTMRRTIMAKYCVEDDWVVVASSVSSSPECCAPAGKYRSN